MIKQEQNQETIKDNESEKHKVKQRLFRLGILLLLILLLLLLLKRCTSEGPIEQGVIHLPETVDIQRLVNNRVEEDMFQVFISTNIAVDSDNMAALLIQNSKENRYTAYVELHCGDKLLYRSGEIKPGFKLEKDRLQGKIDVGSFDGIASFHVIGDDGKEINTIRLNVLITKSEEQ